MRNSTYFFLAKIQGWITSFCFWIVKKINRGRDRCLWKKRQENLIFSRSVSED